MGNSGKCSFVEKYVDRLCIKALKGKYIAAVALSRIIWLENVILRNIDVKMETNSSEAAYIKLGIRRMNFEFCVA